MFWELAIINLLNKKCVAVELDIINILKKSLFNIDNLIHLFIYLFVYFIRFFRNRELARSALVV